MRILMAQKLHDHVIPALIIWLAFALPQDSCAVEVTGNVVGITDGDTTTVLDTGKQQHEI